MSSRKGCSIACAGIPMDRGHAAGPLGEGLGWAFRARIVCHDDAPHPVAIGPQEIV